jgi:DNA polymerase III delta prime subunit
MESANNRPTRILLRLPADCTSPVLAIDRWLVSLWQLTHRVRSRFWWNESPISLEILATRGQLRYQVALQAGDAIELTTRLLPSYFPGLECEPAEFGFDLGGTAIISRLQLVSPGWVELANEAPLDVAAGLLSAMELSYGVEAVILQWLLQPTSVRWERQPGLGFWVVGRLAVSGRSTAACVAAGRTLVGALGQVAGENRVSAGPFRSLERTLELSQCRWPRRFLPPGKPCMPRQIAFLYHPPLRPASIENLSANSSPRLPVFSASAGMLLGEGRTNAGRPAELRLPVRDLMRHLLVVGPSGSGKTTLLASLAREALTSEAGITVLDPHGGLVDEVARTLPAVAESSTALIRIANRERPIGINPFQSLNGALAADDFVEILRRTTGRSHWGPVLDLALRHVALAMGETGGSMVEAARLLEDELYRERLVGSLRNEATARFFGQAERGALRLQPALTRLQRLTASAWMRNILGQSSTTVDFGSIMDGRRSLLVDLSGLGLGAAQLVGSLLLSLLRRAALSRRAGAFRHVVMLDEAALFLSPTVAELLDQARKFNVGLVLATQRLGQLEPDAVRNALLANVGSTVAFRIHDRDEAAALARRAADARFTPEALMRLPRFEAYGHLTVDDDRREPAWFRVPAPPARRDDSASLLRTLAHAGVTRYTRARSDVEAELTRRDECLDVREPEVLDFDASDDPFHSNPA